MLRMWRRIRKETDKMGYKKDMSKYENLEGWERCGFGEQLDRWAEKYGEILLHLQLMYNMEKELRSRTVRTRSVIWN